MQKIENHKSQLGIIQLMEWVTLYSGNPNNLDDFLALGYVTNKGGVGSDYILTEDSHFIKDFNYNDMTPIKCDVISVAAINLNNNHIDIKEKYNIDYDDLMTTKIYNMLIACKNCNTIILGAWGCGVFNNDPKVVSKLFKQTIEKYNLDSLYDNIIFAVINDHNSVDNNFKIFKDEFTRSIQKTY